VLAYWFVIALHFGVAFTNVFLFVTPGAGGDVNFFHQSGVALAQSENFLFFTRGKLYQSILGVVYWIFEPSLLLGSQLSILMFAFSCVVLIKILVLLDLSRYKVSVILVFGALPSMFFLGSVPLRESYQILFFMLATYCGLRMLMGKNKMVYGVFMVVSAWIMGMFHNGLIIFSVFLVPLFMFYNIYSASGWLAVRKGYSLKIIVMLTLISSIFFFTKLQYVDLGAYTSAFNIDIWKKIVMFQSRSLSVVTRATYYVPLDGSSFFTAAYTSLILYFHYLFSPFPWQIENIMDAGACLEAILRMVLIGFSFKYLCRAHGVQFRLLLLMLILFFSMSFMWAMGTTNYGTAIRHNTLSWWVLAITGTPLLMEMLSRIRLGSALHRCVRFLGQVKKIS